MKNSLREGMRGILPLKRFGVRIRSDSAVRDAVPLREAWSGDITPYGVEITVCDERCKIYPGV